MLLHGVFGPGIVHISPNGLHSDGVGRKEEKQVDTVLFLPVGRASGMRLACAPVFEDNSFVGLRAGERARAVRAGCDRLVLATKEAGQGATTMGDVRDGGLEGGGRFTSHRGS